MPERHETPEAFQAALADRYAIERELGRGGMATVFLAEDLRHHRKVAIKVLRAEIAMGGGQDRFSREIRIIARLSHPNILPMHESGEAAGLLYYVMPYVEGESLRDRLDREGQLSVPEVIRIAREVSDALSYAHRRGVVHRDIKPENIMLSAGHAVVTDFGIARAVDAAAGDRLTSTGLAIGTPAYMGPEQWSGEKVDNRSDLYSLGCVVYEMLIGEPPFRGPTPQVVLARQSSGTIPSIRAVRSTVSIPVEAAVFRALALVPADRFATVDEFCEALIQVEQPATAAPPPIPVARPSRRRWVIGGAAGAVLGLAALGFFLLRPDSPGPVPDTPRVVVALFENRTGDASLDDIGSLASDWITVGLQRSGLLDVVPAPTALQSSRYVASAMANRQVTDPIRALSEETGAGLVREHATAAGPVRHAAM